MVTLTDEEAQLIQENINKMAQIIEEQSEKIKEFEESKKLDEAFDFSGMRKVLGISEPIQDGGYFDEN